MTCKFARHEPSLTSRKLKPPLLSRRVRIQPCTRTLWQNSAAWRPSLTEIFSIERVLPCETSWQPSFWRVPRQAQMGSRQAAREDNDQTPAPSRSSSAGDLRDACAGV